MTKNAESTALWAKGNALADNYSCYGLYIS